MVRDVDARVYHSDDRYFLSNELIRIQFDPKEQRKGTLCINDILYPGTYEIGSARLEIISAGRNYGEGVVLKTGSVHEGDPVKRVPYKL